MENFYYLCDIINMKNMSPGIKHKVLLSDEVDQFLDTLPIKAKTKSYIMSVW